MGDLARYHAFTLALSALRYPPGSIMHMVQSISVAANLNVVLRHMAPEHQWLWCQSDDHVFPPDILYRLLSWEVDVVVPLITRRHPPFSTVVFSSKDEDGYHPIPYDELPEPGENGLIECYAAGTGGMLIRRTVIERLIAAQGHDSVFEFAEGDIMNEDVRFCHKLAALDPPVKIWCDVGAQMGHCGTFVVWPYFQRGENGDGGKWGLRFQMGEGPDGQVRGIFIAPNERTEEENLEQARRLAK